MHKKLTVIIPVYNGSAYIGRCIESVLKQESLNLQELELLIINDGSKDESLKIIKGYQKKYPKVLTLIDQQNKGAAYSRNKGISVAKGTYVSLIDQDDYVDSDYFATLLGAIEEGNYDVVHSGFRLTNAEGTTVKIVQPVDSYFGSFLAIPAWAKIYRTNFLREHTITFFDNNIGEDSVFTTKVILFAEEGKYKKITYAGYHNSFDNTSSVTNTLHKGLSPSVNSIALLDELKKISASNNDKQKLLDYNILRTTVYYLLSYGRYAEKKRFIEVYKQLFSWLQRNIDNVSRNPYIFKRPKGESLSASLGIKLLFLLHHLRAMSLFAKIYCKGEK